MNTSLGLRVVDFKSAVYFGYFTFSLTRSVVKFVIKENIWKKIKTFLYITFFYMKIEPKNSKYFQYHLKQKKRGGINLLSNIQRWTFIYFH